MIAKLYDLQEHWHEHRWGNGRITYARVFDPPMPEMPAVGEPEFVVELSLLCPCGCGLPTENGGVYRVLKIRR